MGAATAVAVSTLVEAAVNTLVDMFVVAVLTLVEGKLLTPAKLMSGGGKGARVSQSKIGHVSSKHARILGPAGALGGRAAWNQWG